MADPKTTDKELASMKIFCLRECNGGRRLVGRQMLENPARISRDDRQRNAILGWLYSQTRVQPGVSTPPAEREASGNPLERGS